MKRDQSYIKAVELFNDGEYEQAYTTIDGSTSITSEELQQFKSNCLTFISQQYVYLIKDAISNSNYEEALSLKERFLSKYGNNDEIWSLEIPRQNPQKQKSTAEENHKRESQSTQPKRKTSEYVIAGIFLLVLVISIIRAITNISDNYNDYDSRSEGVDTVSAFVIEEEAVAAEYIDPIAKMRSEKLSKGIVGEVFKSDYFDGDKPKLILRSDNTFIDTEYNRSGYYTRGKKGITFGYSDADGEDLIWNGRSYSLGSASSVDIENETIYNYESGETETMDQFLRYATPYETSLEVKWYN